MSFANFEFPNTNFYNSDLRELISMYKKLLSEYDAIKSEIDTVIGEYGSILSDVKSIKNQMKQIENTMSSLEKTIITKVNITLDDTVKKLEEENENLRLDVSDYMTQIKLEMISLQNNVNKQMDELVVIVKGYIKDVERYSDTNDSKLKNYVDTQDSKIIDIITNIKTDQTEAIDPVDNTIKPMQLVLNSMFHNLKSWGLQAIDYDALRLSAEDYDNFNLRAWSYEYLAKWYLRERPKLNLQFENIHKCISNKIYAYSPITGIVVSIRDLCYEICGIIRDMAIEAQEYDAMGLTADEYENKNFTAYIYDWYAKMYLSTEDYSITAQEYDDTHTTAIMYDLLGLTAIIYDRSARLVFLNGVRL